MTGRRAHRTGGIRHNLEVLLAGIEGGTLGTDTYTLLRAELRVQAEVAEVVCTEMPLDGELQQKCARVVMGDAAATAAIHAARLKSGAAQSTVEAERDARVKAVHEACEHPNIIAFPVVEAMRGPVTTPPPPTQTPPGAA